MTGTDATIAFVGLGAIGSPMAARLRAGGHRVLGIDPSPEARARGREADIAVAETIAAAGDAQAVIVMVATPAQLQRLAADAAAAGIGSGQTWVVMSTVGTEAVASASAELAAAGAVVVDAPVTGGVARARTGELAIFAAGEDVALDEIRPALSLLGAVHRVGREPGAGQAVKVVNQHLCSVHLAAAAEALALTRQLGLEPDAVLPLLESGAAGSWMLSDRGRRMLGDPDVEPTSRIDIFVKDSGLVAQAAQAVGAETPVLDAARARYLSAADAGWGARDDSRVIDTYTAHAAHLRRGR
ncbi:NAD(P)-dependent oxidoreductase [Microbacterium sp. Root53]|uniref:NAD(P)-dependent oxidoreductase n=1 Tax=Microbacterium sp. Root53 TaxID=1736553 RepID=UPI000AF8A0C9|nr:NAD(P)-dependent oxidoreductase [Microbacterium sp. Root53]